MNGLWLKTTCGIMNFKSLSEASRAKGNQGIIACSESAKSFGYLLENIVFRRVPKNPRLGQLHPHFPTLDGPLSYFAEVQVRKNVVQRITLHTL